MREIRSMAGALVVIAFALLSVHMPLQAQSTDASGAEGPQEVVTRVTTVIVKIVEDQGHLLETEPQKFYNAVSEVLSPVVAFDYIAKGVMGRYAKEASADQLSRFAEVFQSNLISTYAKGMALYGSQEVVVLPLDGELGQRRRVSVVQKVITDAGENSVIYTMGKSKQTGEWMLLNVVINGVNLGNTFRSQFAQAMNKAGDIDIVIDSWSAG